MRGDWRGRGFGVCESPRGPGVEGPFTLSTCACEGGKGSLRGLHSVCRGCRSSRALDLLLISLSLSVFLVSEQEQDAWVLSQASRPASSASPSFWLPPHLYVPHPHSPITNHPSPSPRFRSDTLNFLVSTHLLPHLFTADSAWGQGQCLSPQSFADTTAFPCPPSLSRLLEQIPFAALEVLLQCVPYFPHRS